MITLVLSVIAAFSSNPLIPLTGQSDLGSYDTGFLWYTYLSDNHFTFLLGHRVIVVSHEKPIWDALNIP
jgi:hypothetical protein